MVKKSFLGPWQYRKFMRWSTYFFKISPWLWGCGMVGLLVVVIFNLDERYNFSLGLVCLLTIWPAIIGWLGLNGIGILWAMALGAQRAIRKKQRPDALGFAFIITFLFAGVVFVSLAIMGTYSLLIDILHG